jgi:hypothetical protein
VEKDLNIMGVRYWRCKLQDWDLWRALVEEAKVMMDYSASRRRRIKTSQEFSCIVVVIMKLHV